MARATAPVEPAAAGSPAEVSVSVVIPNLNGEHLLEACLRSLEPGHGQGLEVVLVDNGSSDRSLDVARGVDLPVRIIGNDVNLGFARACNQGAQAARSEYVLFLNSDVVLSQNCLGDLLAGAWREPKAAAWQPKLLLDDRVTWDSAGSYFTKTGFLWHEGLGERGPELFDQAKDMFALKGACLLVRRSAFEQVGGFDEDFFAYFEDSDLCWRLHLAGWQVRFLPICCALHRRGATTSRMFASPYIDYLSFRNRIASIVKNAGPVTLATVLPVHLMTCTGIALLFFARGQWRNGFAVFRAMLTSALRTPELVRRRRAVQALRLQPDRRFLRRLSTPMRSRYALRLLAAYLPRW